VSLYDPQDQITVPPQQGLELVYPSLKNPRYDFIVIELAFVPILFQVTESAPDVLSSIEPFTQEADTGRTRRSMNSVETCGRLVTESFM